MSGFRAFDIQDYEAALKQFRAALTIAYEEQAPAEDIGGILENIATTFLAADRPERAWQAIERWDKILAAARDETWTSQQRTIRDDLATLILQALNEAESPENPNLAAVETTGSTVSGDFALHLESIRNLDNIQPTWERLRVAYPALLADTSLVVQEADVGDQGTFHRLLAAPFTTSAEAKSVCAKLSALGQYCAVLSLK